MSLVLTRNNQEAIVIGNNIRILVVRAESGHVRLAITAPPEMVIMREELIGREKAERERSK